MTPRDLITRAFTLIAKRPPTDAEVDEWLSLINDFIKEVEQL